MSKTKPVIVKVTYKPPDQLRFLEILCNLLNTLKILNEKWYVIRDLSGTNETSSETKKYMEFCQTFEFKQIMQTTAQTS